ncbi:MAG: DUF3592 domain-containing protein [Pseudomonadota bacterium]
MDVLAEKRTKAAWAALLFGVISLAGLFAAFAAVKDFAYARASGRWAQTNGVVLSSDNTDFRYAYHWQGKSREGHRISFFTRGFIGTPPPTKPGSMLDVYVSPSDPDTSVLVPGGSGRRFAVWIAFCGAIVFTGVAGLTRAMLAFDFPEYGDLDRSSDTDQNSLNENTDENDQRWQDAYDEDERYNDEDEWGEPLDGSSDLQFDETVYERLKPATRIAGRR